LSTLSTPELTRLSHTLARALSVDQVNQLGRDTGQAQRLRTVTPHRLFLAMVSTLGSGRVESLADLLRAFNHQNGVAVAYKAFYNRLARIGFATFMRGMLARLIDQLRLETLTPDGQKAVARFHDIVIHDGSSFALKAALSGRFPGRFTAIEPAAVEVHATYSGFADEVSRVQIAPDATAERPFLPDPATLTDQLLLADRGYPSVAYFEAVRAHGGSFIVRLTRTYDPEVRAAWVEGRRAAVPAQIRLSRFLAQHAGQRVDLDVAFHGGPHVMGFRVVVLPGRDAAMTRLCTNLPRTPFAQDLVARLYRFRWQIELCFKEWKSYANLHQFDTANAHIAEGLIWASLCAAVLKRFLAHAAQRVGGTAMSTRRVAMCAHHILDALVAALLLGVGLRGTLRRGLAYLLANARRANPDRDRRTGRLRAGLGLAEAA
jgi:hypothetical protein